MSDTVHHAIIVIATIDYGHIKEIAEKAAGMGFCVLGPSAPQVNAWSSILLCPDGSGVGYPVSDEFDEKRAEFKRWLEKQSRHGWNQYWAEVRLDHLDAEVICSHATEEID